MCNVIEITISQKTSSHPSFEEGSRLGFVANGIEGGTLKLQRHVDYLIQYHNDGSHPLYFSTSPVGKGEGRLTSNILESSIINFDDSFPRLFYYQCANHAQMGGEVKLCD